nr:DnaD domain protein [Lachnospiraceae bacterium]
ARKKVSYSASKVSSFEKKPEIRQLIFGVETLMRQTLSRRDMEDLLFMHDELKFPVDLIEYLIEHCLDSGANNMKYFMEVAYSWDEKGIHTTEAAREYVLLHNKNTYAVMQEFGIKDRSITPVEAEYLKKWEKKYGFGIDIIKEAASRTIKQLARVSFAYADTILSSWYEAGVKTLEDIETLDKKHSENTKARYRTVRNIPARPQTNRFKNFSEREYDDMSSLEKELLSKSMAKAGDF